MPDRKVRVRFAPSPTGPLHIGGVRTALYNYLFAKKHDGDFILRIEDTDKNRYVPGAESYILETFDWCGLPFDEGIIEGGEYGPYRQSERKGVYEQYAVKLVEEGKAYYAFDTPEALEEMRKQQESSGSSLTGYNHQSRKEMRNSLTLPPEAVEQLLDEEAHYVIRIKIPEDEEIHVRDEIRQDLVFQSSTLDDKVIFKSDRLPTYHLANVVDDYLMKITHVIRGEEWLPSLPLHVLLYTFLGWEEDMPAFAHLPLILKPTGKGKLSKRDGEKMGFPVFPLEWMDPETGEVSSGYKQEGYFPEAFINLLVMLGWNPGTAQEIFSLDEMVEAFSLDRVGRSGARFDPDKARWFNHQYLAKKDDQELANEYARILRDKKIEAEPSYIEKVVGLIKERADFVRDFWDQSFFFFQAPQEYDQKIVKKRWKQDSPEILKDLFPILEKTAPWERDVLEKNVKAFIEYKELGMGRVMIPVRLCLVGSGMGPDLFTIMEMIGREGTLDRIKKGIHEIPGEN